MRRNALAKQTGPLEQFTSGWTPRRAILAVSASGFGARIANAGGQFWSVPAVSSAADPVTTWRTPQRAKTHMNGLSAGVRHCRNGWAGAVMAYRCGRYLRNRPACTGRRTRDWCANCGLSCTSRAECSTNGSPNVRHYYGGCHEQFAGSASGASLQCEDAGGYARRSRPTNAGSESWNVRLPAWRLLTLNVKGDWWKIRNAHYGSWKRRLTAWLPRFRNVNRNYPMHRWKPHGQRIAFRKIPSACIDSTRTFGMAESTMKLQCSTVCMCGCDRCQRHQW